MNCLFESLALTESPNGNYIAWLTADARHCRRDCGQMIHDPKLMARAVRLNLLEQGLGTSAIGQVGA
ncbi:hypothetical protein ASF88_04235 [Leifsonia sp. Leaf336]|nr:hypothetical protein ASF88_04235 [Leifsonia sp. Leaf336]